MRPGRPPHGTPPSPRMALHPPAQEGQPLEEETARLLHALRVRAPVLQAVSREVLQDGQALGRRDIPVPLLLDLREQPRLQQGTPGSGVGSAGLEGSGALPLRQAQPTFKAQEFQPLRAQRSAAHPPPPSRATPVTPSREENRRWPVLRSAPGTERPYRAIITPATPVCMARLASSYDKMSPFPEGQRRGLREPGAGGSSGGASGSPVMPTGAGQGPRWGRGTHRTVAWGWLPSHTARCTPSRPAWCSAAPGSGRGAEGEATRGEGEPVRGVEDQTQRERPRDTKRDGLRERQRDEETDGDRDGGRAREQEEGAGRERPLGRAAHRALQWGPPRPPCPETHRDQGRAPVPQLREQAVGQVHALLDAGADLHGQRHVQHLRGAAAVSGTWAGRGRGGRWGRGCTWFMPRTICWNLAVRFMRAQPPPWEKVGTGARDGGMRAGPATLLCRRQPNGGNQGAAAPTGPPDTQARAWDGVPGYHPRPHHGGPGLQSSYLLVHEVDGAPNVDVHEVHVHGAVEQLGALGHGVREGALKLRPGAEQGVRGRPRLALPTVGIRSGALPVSPTRKGASGQPLSPRLRQDGSGSD